MNDCYESPRKRWLTPPRATRAVLLRARRHDNLAVAAVPSRRSHFRVAPQDDTPKIQAYSYTADPLHKEKETAVNAQETEPSVVLLTDCGAASDVTRGQYLLWPWFENSEPPFDRYCAVCEPP